MLGAGASHGLHHLEDAPADYAWQPPLANQLFSPEKHAFREALKRYPGAHQLQQAELGAVSKKGAVPLEQMLRGYSRNSSLAVREQFKDIPPYIRDVVRECATRFLDGSPGAYAVLLQRLLARDDHDVAFVVLNYDTLLEEALRLYYEPFRIVSLDDYTNRADGRPLVVKVHGSTNWFRAMPSADTWRRTLAAFDLDSPIERLTVWDPESPTDSRLDSGGSPSRWMYPVITAPLAQKSEDDLVCPEAHLEALREFIQDCDKYIFIGTSGLDADLLSFLSVGVPDRSRLMVVAKADTIAVAKRIINGVRGFRGVPEMENAGLVEFLAGSELESMLAT